MGGCCLQRANGVPASGGGGGSTNTVTLQGVIVPQIVPATATGSTDDLVLAFTGASVQVGSVPLASWVTRTDSPVFGTTLTMTQPGIYAAYIYIPWASGNNVGAAVTYNATVAQRQSIAPEPVQPETYASSFTSTSSIQTTSAGNGLIPVLQADIDAGTNIIRAHSFNPLAPGTSPPAAAYINAANTALRLFRIGDVA